MDVHLNLADPRIRLCVADLESGSGGVVQAHVSDPQVAQLARPNAASREDLDHRPTADVPLEPWGCWTLPRA
jgi:hypothetical protein